MLAAAVATTASIRNGFDSDLSNSKSVDCEFSTQYAVAPESYVSNRPRLGAEHHELVLLRNLTSSSLFEVLLPSREVISTWQCHLMTGDCEDPPSRTLVHELTCHNLSRLGCTLAPTSFARTQNKVHWHHQGANSASVCCWRSTSTLSFHLVKTALKVGKPLVTDPSISSVEFTLSSLHMGSRALFRPDTPFGILHGVGIL